MIDREREIKREIKRARERERERETDRERETETEREFHMRLRRTIECMERVNKIVKLVTACSCTYEA